MVEISERPWWPSSPSEFDAALRVWIGEQYDKAVTVRTWWRRLANAGLTAPTWPRVHGGLALTTQFQGVVEAALADAEAVAPPVDNVGFRAIAPALRQLLPIEHLGTWLEPLLRGEHAWTLLVDEPDLAEGEVAATVHKDWKYHIVDGAKRLADPTATHALVLLRSAKGSTGTDGLCCYVMALDDGEGVEVADGVVRFTEHKLLPEGRIVGREGGGWEVVKVVQPYLAQSLAGRIRRGLVNLPPGPKAGALDLTIFEALERRAAAAPPAEDRRRR